MPTMGMLLCLAVIAALPAGRSVCAAADAINSEGVVVIENAAMRLEFSGETGGLVRILNRRTGGDYFKESSEKQNPFRLYMNCTQEPGFLSSEGVQPDLGDLGGTILDPADFRLTGSHLIRSGSDIRLTLVMDNSSHGLTCELSVSMEPDGDAAALELTVKNASDKNVRFMTAFPYLRGLGLGENSETNLGVRLHVFGQSRGKAWADAGDIYGRHWASQWNAVYEPSSGEAIGIVVQDAELKNKVIQRHPDGIMNVTYFDMIELTPGSKISFPETKLLVYKGNWMRTAVVYGEWFRKSFKLRRAPEWLRETNMFIGAWIPAPKDHEDIHIDRAMTPLPFEFDSFRDFPRLYLQPDLTWETCGKYDLKEWAQYWEGVNRNKIYAAYQHVDGIYDFRSDLGGSQAFRAGVAGVEKIGRHVGLYVASRTVRNDSEFFSPPYPGAGTKPEDWLWMTTPDTQLPAPEKSGHQSFFMSPRNPAWQDYLAETVKKLLKQSGAKYVRLDEFWSTFVIDHNPRYIKDPLNGTPEVLEFLRKIRAAIDEVDPDVALFTEGATDITAQYVDGTLCMFASGPDIDPMRIVIPEFVGFSYHLGQIDCALQGYVCACEFAANRPYAWWEPHFDGIAGPGMEKMPTGYPEPPESEIWGVWPQKKLRWYELQYTFKEAARGNDPVLENPAAVGVNPESWCGRVWKSPRYWLLVCGSRWAEKPQRPIRVRLPELPDDITYAIEFDTETLEMRRTGLVRNESGIYVDTHYGFSAVLLPKPDCPALVELSEPVTDIPYGSSKQIGLAAYAPWRTGGEDVVVNCEVPGLSVSGGKGLQMPGTVTIRADGGVETGYYYLKVTGECLPVKRWFKVE